MQTLLRTLIVGAVVALVAPAVDVFAQATDPVLGTWKLNVAKSKYDPGPAPKSTTLTYEAAGQGVKITSKGVDAAGNQTGIQYTANYDGKDYPVTGSADFDATTLKRIDALTVEATRKKAGKVVQTGTRVVSKDRNVLTITTKGINAKGQPINNIAVYER